MNIILTGLRGTGKTSLGKLLAQEIEWNFVDIDDEIERLLNKKIDQYVAQNGWKAFRKKEKEATQNCANLNQTVISTGGGTLMDEENGEVLKKNGIVVLLTCSFEQLRNNLAQSYERPSLTNHQSALEELEEVWENRKERYHAVADLVHDTTDWPGLHTLLKQLKSIESLQL